MEKQVLAAFAAVLCSLCGAAPTVTTTWQGVPGTDPAVPGDWFADGAWDNGTPNSKEFKAIISSMPEGSFISFGNEVTVGALSAPAYSFYGTTASNQKYIYGGTLITDNESSSYVVSGGNLFCDVVCNDANGDGFAGGVRYAGRINHAERFCHAGGDSFHRLCDYATSVNPLRMDDFQASYVHHGSGNFYTVAPRIGVAHAEDWQVTPGSPFVTRASAPASIVAAGAVVTCPGVLPEGTFVKRIFNQMCLELSNPVSSEAEEGKKTLSFAAINPQTRITVDRIWICTYVTTSMAYLKLDPEGDLRVDVMKINSNSSTPSPVNFHNSYSAYGYSPARVVIHDAAPAKNGYEERLLLMLGNIDVEFAETGREGAASGIPAGTATTTGGAASISYLTVTNNIEASIGLVTNMISTVVKRGAGSLTLGMTNDVGRNTGKLTVEAGTLALPAGSWVKTVEVKAGGALKIAGEFAPAEFVAEQGAKIVGEGTLILPDTTQFSKLDLATTITVGVAGGTPKPLMNPEYKVVGDPAFWVDATNRDTIVFAEGSEEEVVRINDVRKRSEDDGYMFATNMVARPKLIKATAGTDRGILFSQVSTRDTSLIKDLVWSAAITNITAVFQVLDVYGDTASGGGQFLGWTSRVYNQTKKRGNDWTRDAGAGWVNDIFYRNNTGTYQLAVLNGELSINGEPRTQPCGYLYSGGTADLPAPQVVEIVPTRPVAADCFAYDYGADNSTVIRNGRKTLCELIVYTNKLNYAERKQIAGYLMKKWIGCEIGYDEIGGGSLGAVNGGSFAAKEGETLAVRSLSGSVVKSGEGELFVEDLQGDGTVDLDVRGGVVEVRTPDAVPATIAELPAGALYHMDADDATTYTYDVATMKMTSNWKSSVGAGSWNRIASYSATVVTNHANGRTMLDLSNPRYSTTHGYSPYFTFTKQTNVRTMFMVEDTAQAGTTLFGNTKTYSVEGAMRDQWKTRWYDNKGTKEYLVTDALIANDQNFLVSDVWKASRIRLNGERVDPTKTGFTGGIDMVSAVGYDRMTTDAFAYNVGHGNYSGGGMIGEYILYDRCLTEREVRKVEGYLSNKWKGVTPAEFAPKKAGTVTLALGTTLKVSGETPFNVVTLAGSGTVLGSVGLGDGFVAIVDEDGTIGTVTVTGDVASAGGTVTLGGAVQTLMPGIYRLLSAASADIGSWTFVAPTEGRASRLVYTLSVDDEGLVLKVDRRGSLLIMR